MLLGFRERGLLLSCTSDGACASSSSSSGPDLRCCDSKGLGLPCTADGAYSSSSSPSALPWLLHGDLRSHNIHFTLPMPATPPAAAAHAAAGGSGSPPPPAGAAAAIAAEARSGPVRESGSDVCVLDFADAGHGDPLYDLVVMIGGCLSADAALARACWMAYKADVDVHALWPHHCDRVSGPAADADPLDLVDPADPVDPSKDPVGVYRLQPQQQPCVSLSYVAMCYCLLLEEDVVLEKVCMSMGSGEHGASCVLIADLQRTIWGFLDE